MEPFLWFLGWIIAGIIPGLWMTYTGKFDFASTTRGVADDAMFFFGMTVLFGYISLFVWLGVTLLDYPLRKFHQFLVFMSNRKSRVRPSN